MSPERFPSSAGPPSVWGTIIPTAGTLLFDYLSYARAPATAAAVPQDTLIALLVDCGLRFLDTKPVLPAGAVFSFWVEYTVATLS